jgi:thymidylate synthase
MIPYLNLLQAIRDKGIPHEDRTGVGTLSLFGYQFRHHMADGFPLLTSKRVPLRWVAEELFWILKGDTNEANLRAKGVDIWAEWATAEKCAKFGREEGDLGPIYGWQLRRFGEQYAPLVQGQRPFESVNKGHDQLATLLNDLHNNPFSRRHVVSYWNPAQVGEVELPPCHTLWQVKVEHPTGFTRPYLSLELFARSIDSFLGLPFNIASYGLLLTMLAHVCDMGVGDLVISFGDVHIYNNHMTQVETQLKRNVRELPRLEISSRLWGKGLSGLLSTTWADLDLQDYKPGPSISAEVAI